MEAIKNFLSKDKAQRLFYLISIILWTFFCWQDDLSSDQPNEIIWAIPTVLFLMQILFNHKVFWKLIFITLSIYSGFVILLLISGLLAHHTASITLICIMISFLLVSICWLIYHMEPNFKKEKIKS
jgi:hypothetical protein